MNRRLLLAGLIGAALLVTACGSDDEDAAAGVTIEGAWARNSPMMAENGAAYMQLTSEGGDRLLSAGVDESIAAEVQIHETVMAETETTADTAMTEDTAMPSDPVMEMRQIESLELPAGETVSLEPGGYHLMILGLAEPLELGETITITLTFEEAGDQDVSVVVADEAP